MNQGSVHSRLPLTRAHLYVISPTFAVDPDLAQATPTLGVGAACEVPTKARLETRIMAMEIASDDIFLFIDSPFIRCGNQCRTVGELVIVHGSCGLLHSLPRRQRNNGIMARW